MASDLKNIGEIEGGKAEAAKEVGRLIAARAKERASNRWSLTGAVIFTTGE